MNSTIRELYENERKDGGIYWTVILDDGERYGVFDTKVGPTLQQGKAYEFSVVTKGQFKNIIKATPIMDVNEDIKKDYDSTKIMEPEPKFVLAVTEEKPIETTAPPQRAVLSSPQKTNGREESIARSVALKCVSQMVDVDSDEDIKFAIFLAKRFYAYLTTGN